MGRPSEVPLKINSMGLSGGSHRGLATTRSAALAAPSVTMMPHRIGGFAAGWSRKDRPRETAADLLGGSLPPERPVNAVPHHLIRCLTEVAVAVRRREIGSRYQLDTRIGRYLLLHRAHSHPVGQLG